MSCVYFPQSDPETLLKCLTMCAELFKQMNIKRGICPTMNALIESLVLILIHKSTRINNPFLQYRKNLGLHGAFITSHFGYWTLYTHQCSAQLELQLWEYNFKVLSHS